MRGVSIAALAALASLVAGASLAQGAEADALAKRLFAENLKTQGKSYACFVRRYGPRHLAQHRGQKTAAMKLLVSAEFAPEDKALNYSFTLGMAFRDRKGDFQSAGGCGHPTAQEKSPDTLYLGCGVDCDGGGLSIALTDGDKSAMVGIDEIAIWNIAKPGADRDGFAGGAEDKKFRLDRVSLEECKSLMAGNEEAAVDKNK